MLVVVGLWSELKVFTDPEILDLLWVMGPWDRMLMNPSRKPLLRGNLPQNISVVNRLLVLSSLYTEGLSTLAQDQWQGAGDMLGEVPWKKLQSLWAPPPLPAEACRARAGLQMCYTTEC